MPFSFITTEFEGVIIIEPEAFSDTRGFFLETYRKSDFRRQGINTEFMQDNHSFSQKGVLRGLHYQIHPYAQAKLVYAVYGSIFDVAVDIRKTSPAFGKWTSVRLSAENHRMLYIPEGFAHGFLCLSSVAQVIYKCSTEYSPGHEAGIRWNDPDLAINWPTAEPVLSEKDSNNPWFKEIWGGRS